MNIKQKTKFSKVEGLQALESRANTNLKELAKVLTVQEQIKSNILSEISSLPSGGFKATLEELVKSPGQMILVLNMLIEYHNLELESDNQDQIVESEENTAIQTEDQIVESEENTAIQTEEVIEVSEENTAIQTEEVIEVSEELQETKIEQSTQKPIIFIEEKRILDRLTDHQPALLSHVVGGMSLPDGFNLQEFLINYSNLNQVILSSTTTVQDDTVLYKYPNFFNEVVSTKRTALKTNSTIQAIFQIIAQGSATPKDFADYEKKVNFPQLYEKLQGKKFLDLYTVDKSRGSITLSPTQKLIDMLTPELEEEVENISTSSGFTSLDSISTTNLGKLSEIIKKR